MMLAQDVLPKGFVRRDKNPPFDCPLQQWPGDAPLKGFVEPTAGIGFSVPAGWSFRAVPDAECQPLLPQPFSANYYQKSLADIDMIMPL